MMDSRCKSILSLFQLETLGIGCFSVKVQTLAARLGVEMYL